MNMYRLLAIILMAILINSFTTHISLVNASETITYNNPIDFSSYWSFEPFKPLPPRGVSPVIIKIAENESFCNNRFYTQDLYSGYTPRILSESYTQCQH